MKKQLLLFVLAFAYFGADAQISNRILGIQNTVRDTIPGNYVFTRPPNDNRFYVANFALGVRNAISLTNTGTGSATYNPLTGIFNIPSRKKQETFSGITNASGVYTVTFPVAYTFAPNVQANIINGTDTQNIRITSISTTGVTVTVRNRVDVVGLLPT